MKWVTRENVHVDRTGCPWLVKRFIDPKAEFIFLPVEEIEKVIKKEKAIPFDVPGAELGHHGDRCSFDAIIDKYKIEDPALLELANIVRSADTGKAVAPEAAGLDAVMTGISMAAKDDYEAIEKAVSVYDAFYTFCRLRIMRDKYKIQIEHMDKKGQRAFLKEKLRQ